MPPATILLSVPLRSSGTSDRCTKGVAASLRPAVAAATICAKGVAASLVTGVAAPGRRCGVSRANRRGISKLKKRHSAARPVTSHQFWPGPW